MFKKTILFDLDGVLNTYDGKYEENYIPPIRDSAYELIKDLAEDYKIIIFNTRNSLIVSKWIIDNGLNEYVGNITNVKEPAYLLIDDICINFDGNYKTLKEKIRSFDLVQKIRILYHFS